MLNFYSLIYLIMVIWWLIIRKYMFFSILAQNSENSWNFWMMRTVNCLCITKTSYFKLINHVNGLLLESPWGFSRGTNQVIKFWNFHHSLTISGEGRGNIWINHSKGKWWNQSCLGNVDFKRKSKRIRFGELQVDEPEWIHVLGEW